MGLRYGVVGTGWIADAFIEGAREMELYAVCSRTRERGEAFAKRHGAAKVYTDPAQMAQDGELDAVYIASPNALHAEQSRLFLAHGKHVLCEKPLAARPEEIEALQALAGERGLVYMEAIMLLHMPQLAILRQAVARLGQISVAHFDFCQYSSKYPAFLRGETPNIFNPAMETGALLDLGIYCVYPAVLLFGVPESLAASATFLSTGADGAGSAIFRYPDKQAVLTWSKTGQGTAPSQIVGDKGCLTIGSISKLEDMVLTENGKEPQRLWGAEDKPALMGHEAARFAQAIAQPAACAPWLEEEAQLALEVHRCMREIRRLAGIVFPRDSHRPD